MPDSRSPDPAGARAAGGKTVAVIGAGIVGVSTGIWLQRAGHRVILIDRAGPGEGTSYGNAGVLASSAVVPLTVPGLIGKAPGMLLDPKSPLFLRWSYLPRLLPWLARYLSHCRPGEAERIARALTPIIGDSLEQHQALAEGTPAARWIRPSDYLFVYSGRAAYEADAFAWSLRRENGFAFEALGAEALQAYDPLLGPEARFGVRLPHHGMIADPGRYVKDLAAHLQAQGGRLSLAEARDILCSGGRVTGVGTDKGPIACDAAVISAGAWSGALTRRLGLRVPLESERGYHLELYGTNRAPRAPSSIVAGKFVATPMEGRVRLAGIVEFGGLEAPAGKKPVRVLLEHIKRAMPGLTWSETREWMGHRPAPSDSIPLIGEVPGAKGAYLGFGHHHVGLTGGPKTGRILAGLISGERPNLDLAPYRPERFS